MEEKLLDAIGATIQGEIVITKKCGEDVADVKTDMHPFLALYPLLQAVAITLKNAAHTGDLLELDLSDKKLVELVSDLGEVIVDWVKYLEE